MCMLLCVRLERVDGMGSKEKIMYEVGGNGKHIGVGRAVAKVNCHLSGKFDSGEVNHCLNGVVNKAFGNATEDRAITGKRERENRTGPVAVTDLVIPASKRGGDP